MNLVYLCGPITGLSYGECTDWREYFKSLLKSPIQGLSPLRAKDYLSREDVILHSYEDIPLSSARGIITRDFFDCQRCDVIVANFLGASNISIGSVMEIAWGKAFNKPIVAVMEDNNVHSHAMINESIGFKVKDLESAAHIVNAILLP